MTPGRGAIGARIRGSLKAAIDWLFRDRRTGRILIAHVPNLPILLWMGTVIARQVVDSGSDAYRLLEWAGSLTLGWWAIDELVRGVNPWRRLLGLGGLGIVVVGVATRLA